MKRKEKAPYKITSKFVNVSSTLVIIASVVILIIIVFLGLVAPESERRALLDKADDVCEATTIGLGSVAQEAMIGNKRSIINDYLLQLQYWGIDGLETASVIEYRKDKQGHTIGEVIGSLSYKDLGSLLSAKELKPLLQVRNLTSKTIQLKSTNYYEYVYPIRWKVVVNGGEKVIPMGAVRLLFREDQILKTYYQNKRYSTSVALLALLTGGVVVFFYVVLVRALKEKIREIERLSVTDALTKIYNRKKYNDTIHSEVARSRRYGSDLSLILFDIDHFKKINDTYGHDVGDVVLKGVADIVKRAIRETDLFVRWGGEEFIILTPDTGVKETADFAERIRLDIEAHRFEHAGHVTCSFGVSCLCRDDTEALLLKRADNALYQAKETGRNRVKVG